MSINDQPGRLYFADNLRVCLVMLVVAHHAAQAYGPTGGRWPISNPESIGLLGPFFSVNASFMMGLLFLIAGYFTASSFARKSIGGFLKARLIRIGIPLLFFALVINFPITYALSNKSLSFWQYMMRPALWDGQFIYSHLWFLGHLLLYALIYIIWKVISKGTPADTTKETSSLNHWSILSYAVVLWIVSTVVRFWYPIDRWVFWGVPIELAHLPQYLSLFLFGTLAYRNNWFRKLPAKVGMTWFWIGVVSSALVYVYSVMVGLNVLPPVIFAGGLVWRTVSWSLWEAFIATGLCVGLLTLFREKFDKQGKLMAALSASAFSVYIIHLYIVLGLQAVVHSLQVPAIVKFSAVTIAGIVICFAVSYGLKKIPGVKRII